MVISESGKVSAGVSGRGSERASSMLGTTFAEVVACLDRLLR
jgi:hypothetical protein